MNQRGFTMMEIMIVVAIIVMILGLVGSNIVGQWKDATVSMTSAQISAFDTALQDYRRSCGSFPTTAQGGLRALVEKPTTGRDCPRYRPGGYLGKAELPLDPWNGPYEYQSDGRTYTLCSAGEDETVGGSDDICSTAKQ